MSWCVFPEGRKGLCLLAEFFSLDPPWSLLYLTLYWSLHLTLSGVFFTRPSAGVFSIWPSGVFFARPYTEALFAWPSLESPLLDPVLESPSLILSLVSSEYRLRYTSRQVIVMIASKPAEILTMYLPNTYDERYCYINLFGSYAVEKSSLNKQNNFLFLTNIA